MDQNLAKGVWWSEALSAHHYPRYDSFSYVASFEGNKVIYNNHHIHVTSYSDSKFFTAAYELDLDTMTGGEIPYGTVFANGFKLQTLSMDDYSDFDWKQYEIHDGTTTRTVKRMVEPPPVEHYYWRRLRYKLHVNLDGSPTVLTTNEMRHGSSTEPEVRFIEVVDLRTGEIIAQPEIAAISVIGFIGDAVIVHLPDGIFFVNIYTNERMPLDSPATVVEFHYCKESRILACGNSEGVIRFYKWPAFEFVSQIEIQSILVPPNYESGRSMSDMFQLRSFGFDKSKLVASISVYAPFYAVFDIRTGALIQTFFNTSDGHDSFGEIHLAPNGKIVTDHANLAVYDFLSPATQTDIPVMFADSTSVQVTKTYVPALDLAKFAAKKLKVPLHTLQHCTFFAKDKEGNEYRLTGIGSHGKDRNDWNTWHKLDWKELPQYLEAWTGDNQVRNTFQITASDYPYPDEELGSFDITWNRLRQVLLVYERYNKETDRWEFAEPLDREDIAPLTAENEDENAN
jgi:hypothetical protein